MTNYKFSAVLNKKIDTGKVMNALAHMTAGLVASYPNPEMLGVINYENKEGTPHIAPKHPFIVLASKNGSKLRTLRQEAEAKGVHCTSFTEAMTVGTWEDQMKRSKELTDEEMEYFGVCLFGERAVIEELTCKFQLWR